MLPGLRAGKITRGRIGVSVRPVSPDEVEALNLKDRRGAFVAQVPPGPAATAGIEPGDVIVEFNGKPVTRSDDLPQIVAATAPGTTVPVKVIREGKERTFNVRVEELNLEAEATRQADAGGPGRRHGRRLRHHVEQRDAGDRAAVRAAGEYCGAQSSRTSIPTARRRACCSPAT